MSFNETPEEFVSKWTAAGARDALTSYKERVAARVAANKKELLIYHKKHGRRVPPTHPLHYREAEYFSPASSMFDRGFCTEARRLIGVGSPAVIESQRRKVELLTYYHKHKRRVPPTHRLYNVQNRYIVNDPKFSRRAKALLGAAYSTETGLASRKATLLAYYKKHGRRVPTGHPLKLVEHGYLCRNHCNYDERFARIAFPMIDTTDIRTVAANVKKSALLAYYKQHGIWVTRRHPLYAVQSHYRQQTGSAFDPAFVRAARKLLKPRKRP